MTVKHFNNVRVWYKAFGGDRTQYYPKDTRYFAIKLSAIQAVELKDDGFNVKEMRSGWTLVVRIDPDYDEDLSALDLRLFQTAEVFIEGRSYVDPRDNSDRIAAYLISITPNQ